MSGVIVTDNNQKPEYLKYLQGNLTDEAEAIRTHVNEFLVDNSDLPDSVFHKLVAGAGNHTKNISLLNQLGLKSVSRPVSEKINRMFADPSTAESMRPKLLGIGAGVTGLGSAAGTGIGSLFGAPGKGAVIGAGAGLGAALGGYSSFKNSQGNLNKVLPGTLAGALIGGGATALGAYLVSKLNKKKKRNPKIV